jgi:hypothetical protein
VIGQFPWDPFPHGIPLPKGPDPLPALAYEAAVKAADAYRGVRDALRIEGDAMRIGNRFVPVGYYRDVAFIACGSAAGSMALAAFDALHDRLTTGFTVGPTPIPPELPFLHIPLPLGGPGSPRVEEVARGALEVAESLGERQLLLLLLSPGTIAALALPPPGMSGEEFGRFLSDAHARGASGREVGLLARVLARGPVAGRLGAAVPRADIATFVVDHGDGAVLLGGGPVHPVAPGEREQARAVLRRLHLESALPTMSLAELAPGGGPALVGAAPRHRPVRIAGPNDALRAAGDVLFDKKWRSRLAMLQIEGSPELAADRFIERFEGIVAREADLELDHSQGIGAFAMTTLGLPEGADEGPGLARFLHRAQERMQRPEMCIALLRTSGTIGSTEYPPGAVIGRPTDPRATVPAGRARAIPMQAGVTDVGCLAIALLGKPTTS